MICPPGTLSSSDGRADWSMTPQRLGRGTIGELLWFPSRLVHLHGAPSGCSVEVLSGWADGFDAGPAEGRPENLVCQAFRDGVLNLDMAISDSDMPSR